MVEESFDTDILIAQPAQTVWDGITLKAHGDRYDFAPRGADVTAEGAEIYHGTANNRMIHGEVLRLVPPAETTQSFRFARDENGTGSQVT